MGKGKMGDKRKTDLFRDISVKLLFNLFDRSGLSANQITVLNFFTLGLVSVWLFATGHEIIALLVSGIVAMIDYIDGSIARARGGNSKKGAYLDTSLDWVWLMLLIGAISYHHDIMLIGYLALMGITLTNWVQYNGNVNVVLKFPLGISHLLVLGILTRNVDISILLIALTQWGRLSLMYLRSTYE
jgi:hypothetical protein